ncbi:hypothetical protein [Azospirillum sp. ST 5-10]|uniref:hypothetical protein n=1 Tax=unclassified Azospirillum TaxID=2630922 RepID=UPI003F4A3A7B
MRRPAVWGTAVALAAGLALAGPARGADTVAAPGPDAVQHAVDGAVPDLWTVEDVALEPAGAGQVRFRARLRLARPTFAVDLRDGPFTYIRPVAEAGLEKTLTGTARTGDAAKGEPPVVLAPDNAEVLDTIGLPAGELPGRTVVAGTEEAKALAERRAEEAERRYAEEHERREREETLLAEQTAAAAAEAHRAELERQAVAARAEQIADLRAKLLGNDRPAKIAAYEAALGGNDPALRALAVETALRSRDPVLAGLALRDWMARKRTIPVQLYATKEEPQSEAVLRNLGPLTIEIDSFNPVSGNVVGTMGAPGYSITLPSAAAGQIAQTELTLHAYGCALTVRLTEHLTLDGLYRCQTLPTLVARVTLD